MRKLALFAIPAALLLAGTVSANEVHVTGCESITVTHAPATWTVELEPGHLTFGPFGTSGDGPFTVAPGTYGYTFHAASGKAEATGSVVVPACPTPAPSVTPLPTPHATPPATDKVAHEQYVAETRSDVLVVLGLLAALGVAYLAMHRRVRR